MMLSLPLITPRDSHELWYGSSQPYRSSPSYNSNPSDPTQQPSSRRHGNNNNNNNHLNGRMLISSTAPSNTLAALSLEERALRARKQNIASFGYAWIKPAGCVKTMLGMREEEAEREEAANALAAEMNAAFMDDGVGGGPGQAGAVLGAARLGVDGEEAGQDNDDQMLERDLDDDIPDADADGLVEEGEEGLEEEEDVDEDGLMQRDLDDDIPEAFPDEDDNDGDDDDDEDEDEQDDDDFDNEPDLDAEIPAAEEGDDDMMVRDLDNDVPDAAEDGSEQEEEWQHTDTEAEDDDDDARTDPFASSLLRASTTSNNGLPPQPVQRETEAQRRFLQRWSGGGDTFDSSGMMLDEEDLRASLASQGSRRSGFGRRWSRRGGPRDSLE
ncbi:hypothetical protein VTN00DRAFT_7603 [Thermoascus crustaceus]|uniref:uncharacterized protein n=1 Tax=Thermoascus crustaceus TaxID=5088 RepID=UPI003744A11A